MPISLDLVKYALKDVLALQEKLVTVENIQKTVAGILQNSHCGFAVETSQPFHRKAASSGHGAGEGFDLSQPAGDW